MALPTPSSLVPTTQDLPGHTFPWGPREKTAHKTFQAQRTSNNRLFLGAGRSPQLPGAPSANETAQAHKVGRLELGGYKAEQILKNEGPGGATGPLSTFLSVQPPKLRGCASVSGRPLQLWSLPPALPRTPCASSWASD